MPGGDVMPRIAFTIPIMPGRQEQCVKLLQENKAQLDKAHEAVGAVQWCKFVDRDEYVEFIDWSGKTFVELLRECLARPDVEKFADKIGPYLMIPAAAEGEDQIEVLAQFLNGRAMNQAYAQQPPPV
jgi:hypothetical protein